MSCRLQLTPLCGMKLGSRMKRRSILKAAVVWLMLCLTDSISVIGQDETQPASREKASDGNDKAHSELPAPQISIVNLANGQPPQIQFADDFLEDRLKQYDVIGPVTWTKGGLRVQQGAKLIGKVGMAPVANVEFQLESDDRNNVADVETSFGVQLINGWVASVVVLRIDPKTKTSGNTAAGGAQLERDFELQITTTMPDRGTQKPVTSIVRKRLSGFGPTGRWLVRYNHGVVEAWHDGQFLYCGDCGFGDLGLQAIELSQKKGNIKLVGLQLAAREPVAAPAIADPAARQKLIADWQAAVEKSQKLFGQHKFSDYIDSAKRQAELEEQLFGPKSLIPIGTYTTLALAFEQVARPIEALELYDRLLPVCEEKLGERHSQVARLLRDRGECHVALKSLEKALEDLRRSNVIFDLVLGDVHPESIYVREVYALRLNSAGRIREAEQTLAQVISLREQIDGADSPKSVNALGQLAGVQQQTGNLAHAVLTRQKIVDIKARTQGESHPETLQARADLADALRIAGNIGQARKRLEENLQIQLAAGESGQQAAAKTLQTLARISLEANDFDAALGSAERALKLVESIRTSDPANLTEAYSSMGEVHEARKEWTQAAECYQRGIGASERLEERRRYLLVSALEQFSSLEFRRGRLPEALKLSQRALAVGKEIDGPVERSTVRTHQMLGMIYRESGDVESAQKEIEAALQLLTTQAEVERDGITFCWGFLADLAERREKWDEAIELNEKALNFLRTRYGANHWLVGNALQSLGVTYQLNNDWGKAADIYRERHLLLLKQSRSAVSVLSETEAFQSVAGLRDSLNRLISLHRLPKTVPIDVVKSNLRSIPSLAGKDLYELVWETKGIATRAMAARRIVPLDSPTAQAIWQTLVSTRRQIAELALSSDSIGGALETSQLRELTETKERLERALGEASPRFRVADDRDVNSIEDLVASLPADIAVIDFLHSATSANKVANHTTEASNFYEAFIIRIPSAEKPASNESVQWVHIGPGEPIEAAVQAWRRVLGDRGLSVNDNVDGTHARQQAAEKIRELVWSKVAPFLDGIKTVLIVPDGALSRVPWGALPSKKPSRFLIEDFAIATIDQPQRIIELLGKPAPSGNQLLVMGGLNYDQRPIPVSRSVPNLNTSATKSATDLRASTIGRERGVLTAAGKRPVWNALPGTAAEADQVANMGRARYDVQRLKGDEATETQLESLLPSSRYIHLATHGYFADESLQSSLYTVPQPTYDPLIQIGKPAFAPKPESRHPFLLSGLVLAGANVTPRSNLPNGQTDRDGILTAEEIVQLDLSQTELVTLSACETGLGVVADGEGVMGLQRAFAAAGARTVVASLWKVDDTATKALMTEFYHNLWDRNLSKLESLRQAQIAMQQRYNAKSGTLDATVKQPNSMTVDSTPYHWAAFVLSGDWR